MQAAWLMLQQKVPQDYVIATGKCYLIKDFINRCCNYLDLKIKWIGKGFDEKAINLRNKSTIIKIDKNFFRKTEVFALKGDPRKAKKILKWTSKTNLDQLIKIMIDVELKNIETY